jgi:hypothetical protein
MQGTRAGFKGGFQRSASAKPKGLFVNGVWQCELSSDEMETKGNH